MKLANIDVTKLDKAHFFKGAKGTYADLVLIPNKDGTDRFGNDGMVKQGVSKQAREAGQSGPIVGNYKELRKVADAKPKAAPSPVCAPDDDVPF